MKACAVPLPTTTVSDMSLFCPVPLGVKSIFVFVPPFNLTIEPSEVSRLIDPVEPSNLTLAVAALRFLKNISE